MHIICVTISVEDADSNSLSEQQHTWLDTFFSGLPAGKPLTEESLSKSSIFTHIALEEAFPQISPPFAVTFLSLSLLVHFHSRPVTSAFTENNRNFAVSKRAMS